MPPHGWDSTEVSPMTTRRRTVEISPCWERWVPQHFQGLWVHSLETQPICVWLDSNQIQLFPSTKEETTRMCSMLSSESSKRKDSWPCGEDQLLQCWELSQWILVLDMYHNSGMLTTYDELKERIVKAQGKAKDSTTDRLMYTIV